MDLKPFVALKWIYHMAERSIDRSALYYTVFGYRIPIVVPFVLILRL